MGEHDARIHGLIEHGARTNLAAHHPSTIEAQDDLLIPLGAIHVGDGARVVRGRLPVDVSIVVVGKIIAELLKLPAIDETADLMDADLSGSMTALQLLIVGDVFEIGIGEKFRRGNLPAAPGKIGGEADFQFRD